MHRFVIQGHQKRKTRHFDLMLEYSGVLKTWSFTKALKEYKTKLVIQKIRALPDHRLKYLNYEGKISKGRGWVKMWDNGYYHKVLWHKNWKVFLMQGQKIKGRLIILSFPPHFRLLLIPLIRLQQTRYSHHDK